MKPILSLFAALVLSTGAFADDFTILGGMSMFRAPDSGTYWNNNQEYDNFMNPAAWGLRLDHKVDENYGLAVQYTNFGKVTMDALAVSTDAPFPGGYDPATSTCTGGTCAPLRRWRMHSETQSIAIMAVRKFSNWSLEAGGNFYEVRTRGNVLDTDGSMYYEYPEAHYMDVMPMFGVGYQHGPWSMHVQAWFIYAPGITPEAFNQNGTLTFLGGYTF